MKEITQGRGNYAADAMQKQGVAKKMIYGSKMELARCVKSDITILTSISDRLHNGEAQRQAR